MLRFSVFVALVIISCSSIKVHAECSWNQTYIYGQFITTINIKHSEGVRVTWDLDDDTNNITVKYTSNVEAVNHTINGNDVNLGFSYEKYIPSTHAPTTAHASTAAPPPPPPPPPPRRKHKISINVYVNLWIRHRRSINRNAPQIDDCDEAKIHFTIPSKYTKKICVNDKKCVPIMCPLSFLSSSSSHLSDIPSTNSILFSDNYCTLKKPEFWDKWVEHYYKTRSNTEQYIFADSDKDGLVNLLEYYADIKDFKVANTSFLRQRSGNIQTIGTDPKKADTDGDLLLDGFEFKNKMNPKKRDDRNADTDGDGLTNLQEQIRNTNPLRRDTDNDGVDDGEEVRLGTDPLDPSDEGKRKIVDTVASAKVKLTIGDPSGSHSERYVIRIGDIEHQSPGFGIVGYGTYEFKPGVYKITIKHVASNLRRPDYDYIAAVQKVSGNASVSVSDPSRLLGYHYESSYDYTVGKSAVMTVNGTKTCGTTVKSSEGKKCGCQTTCEVCEAAPECYWSNSYCTKETWLKPWTKIEHTCPCRKCLDWYNKEKTSNMTWLLDLNKNFKCPCRVRNSNQILTPIDNPSSVTWLQDMHCNPNEPGNCREAHPGAVGCIRSAVKSTYGAAQQCCYDARGMILRAGTAGAGTPDKYYASSYAVSMIGHYYSDYLPYKYCCKECGKKQECDYYINNLRKGSTTHCGRR